MKMHTYERVRNIAADILGLSSQKINAESSPDDVENWDSVHHLEFVLALEQEFELQLEPDEIEQMKNIGQIAAMLDRKLACYR
jgi:acyl carrier protein